MQPDVTSLATSLHNDYTLGAPIDLGDLKIIPAWRCLVTAAAFGAMAVVSPVAIIVVRGTDVEVMLLKEDVGGREILDMYQGR
ncbi:MAG: hypothetical protein FD169_888 [Bacillota bacterium]|nr:MAG: hypothetical protein FD169_888 [Bacillota bacterium]MBS3950416.1 hypothetical protein [Peptococcaceae bacterium]